MILNDIEKQIELVKSDIFRRFPDCSSTIRILLWDDDTTLVECRYGTLEKIYISKIYDGRMSYEEIDISKTDNMMVSENGLEYYPRNNF